MKTEKQFDAVQMMREIRDRLSREIASLNFEEERRYLDERLRLEAPRLEEPIEEAQAA